MKLLMILLIILIITQIKVLAFKIIKILITI